jgi:PAS domain S-box-containing protein
MGVKGSRMAGPDSFDNSTVPGAEARGGPAAENAILRRHVEELHKTIHSTQAAGEEALRLANARLRAIVEHSSDTIFQIDLKGHYTYANPAAERLTGYSLEELIGMSMFKLVAPEDHAMVRERLARRAAGEALPRRFQFEIVHRLGHRLCVELVTTPLHENGVAIGAQGIARDITDRVRAERELQATRERLERLVASSPAIIYSLTLGEEPRLSYVSPNIRQVLGYTAEQIGDHKQWLRRVHSEDRKAIRRDMALLPQKREGRIEYRYRHADGSWQWMLDEYNVVPSSTGGPAEIVGHITDITIRKEAEEALRLAHVELTKAREDERRRLAGELHDSLGQQLTALHLQIQSLLPDLAGRKRSRDVEELLKNCRDAMAEVRAISHRLHPPLLESVGLAAALRDLAARAGSPAPIEVHCPPALDTLHWKAEVEIAIFRIAQEAIGNAIRHSHAKRIELSLAYRHKRLLLSVRDDGLGFDSRLRGTGLGLATMRDRARTAGGECRVDSHPGGTLVEARIPAEARR